MALDACTWSTDQVGEALEALAHTEGLSPRTVAVPIAPVGLTDNPDLVARWIDSAANWLGVEAEPVVLDYTSVASCVRGSAPALVLLPTGRWLALTRAPRGRVGLLSPDRHVLHVAVDTLRDALCTAVESEAAPAIDRLLTRTGVSQADVVRSRRAILQERLGHRRLGSLWLLRLRPEAPLLKHLVAAGTARRTVILVVAHGLDYALSGIGWYLVGRGALEGHFEPGWFAGWVLTLATQVPFRLLASWSAGALAIDVGAAIKQRLLTGALRLEADEIRHQGQGELLGRVLESGAVEANALSGGFLAVSALTELIFAVTVLAAGAGGLPHALAFVAWVAVVLAMGASYYHRRRGWTAARTAMTNDLVERMVGHRTRIAQEQPERMHLGEDEVLDAYLTRSEALDRSAARLSAVVPRAWLLIGIGILGGAWLRGASSEQVAIGLAGVLMAARTLKTLSQSLAGVVGAAVAWRQVEPLFRAAARADVSGAPSVTVVPDAPPGSAASDAREVLDARALTYRHRPLGPAALRNASLHVKANERLLLEGSSGGGKSTLGAVIAGLRQAESGLLLIEGLDRQTLGGDGWRRRVVAAPQFHENHVLSNTFSFNLLMGRRWPPTPEDLNEAEAVCRDLDLGPLLERMPAGLQQMVGETGWQLSHGEKSRLFIARALLQRARLLVLDESFGALDPETLRVCLRCVVERAPAMIVIAHP